MPNSLAASPTPTRTAPPRQRTHQMMHDVLEHGQASPSAARASSMPTTFVNIHNLPCVNVHGRVSIGDIVADPQPFAQTISNALARASDIVTAALSQGTHLDPAARHTIAGIFGTPDDDVDTYLPALCEKLMEMDGFLHYRLRRQPNAIAATSMQDGPCATYSPEHDLVKLNADSFFSRSLSEQADVLIRMAAVGRASADDYFLLPERRHDIASRFDDDYAESTHRLLSHPSYMSASTLHARVRICEDNFIRKLQAPNLAAAVKTFKFNARARIALLLENTQTLALVARVLSETQTMRENRGADVALPPRPAEAHADYYLRQATRGYRQLCAFSAQYTGTRRRRTP